MDTDLIFLAAALLVRGAGLGGLLIAIMVSAYIGLPREQVPHASIATRIFQTSGGAFGSAILATAAEHQMAGRADSDLHAPAHAYDVSFWWAIGFAVAAAIPTLFLTMRKKTPPQESLDGPYPKADA